MSRRIALVGLSWISADLAGPASDPDPRNGDPYSHASAVAAIPDLELVAGCDISAECARRRSGSAGRRASPGLKVYADYREMLQAERPELVAVVTPDHLHRGVVEVAIEAGARGIFCEKPIATTLEDADAIVAAVRGAGRDDERQLHAALVSRNSSRPAGSSASGDIGRLSQIVVQMGGPRSMLFRNHTHAIDLVNFLADSEPVWVWAELEPRLRELRHRLRRRRRQRPGHANPAPTTTSSMRTASGPTSPA